MNQRNTHRSLRQIAVINAWFDPSENDPKRRTLHANVAFREERLGGGEDSNVYFKVALTRCEVVAVLPEGGRMFKIDPRTLRSTPPKATRNIETVRETKGKISGRSTLSVSSKPNIALEGNAEGHRERSVTERDTQEIEFFDTLHGRSKDGFPSWRVVGPSGEHLDGSLWDAANDPLFTLLDARGDEVFLKDQERQMSPEATLQVRCFREDLRVYDIELKDPAEKEHFFSRKGNENRLRAAEAYLKRELLKEGLVFGDLSDLYSELLLADVVVPIYE